MHKLLTTALVCPLFMTFALCTPAFAQQEKGDTEVGLSAIGFLTHKQVTGNATVIGSLGKYVTKNQYLGFNAGPSFSFSKGTTIRVGNTTQTTPDNTSVTGIVGFNYRYLFGNSDNKLWPFAGMSAGGSFTKSNNPASGSEVGGSQSAGTTSTGYLGPELGIKYYARQNVAIELSYSFNVSLGTGGGGSVLDRSSSLALFGFKYLF